MLTLNRYIKHITGESTVLKVDVFSSLGEFYWTKMQKQLSEVPLGKGFLKICIKFTAEHPCRNVISIKLQRNLRLSNLRLLSDLRFNVKVE